MKLAANLNRDRNVTGVVEAISMAETLTAIEKLNPKSDRVYVLGGANRSSRANMARFNTKQSVLTRMKGEILSLDDMTYAELAERVKSIPKEAAILIFGLYRDKSGPTKTYLEGLQMVMDNTDAAIYSLWGHGLGYGVLGGKVISHREQGRVAAGLATQILKGTAPGKIPVVTTSPNIFTFDHRVMERHGIAVSDLPPGSTVLNRPKSWIEENKDWLPWFAIFLVAQFAVIVYLALNVGQRRQAEKRARQSEQRFRDLAQSASDWLWEMDSDLRFTYLSERYEAATGDLISERIGRRRFDQLASNIDPVLGAAIEQHLEDLANRKPFRDFEYPASGPAEGQIRWVRTSGVPIYGADGSFEGYRGSASDITEEVNAQNAIIEARQQAEMSNRAKSEFLAHMSHELRTPLNGIIGFSQIMDSESFGPLGSDKYREYATDITKAGNHLLAVLNDILDLSRIEAGATSLEEEDFDLVEAVDTCLRLVGDSGKDKHVSITSELPEDLPVVRGDERRIKQLFINLLTNAVKFSKESGNVVISGALDANGLTISVRDDGIGIPEDYFAIIREPFGRVEGNMTRSFEGVGLGLPIAETIMNLHGGSLTIDSTEGEGTEVQIHFPADRILAEDTQSSAAAN